MSILDDFLGGTTRVEMITVVEHLVEKHGGVQGLISQFEQQGMGGTIQSWVGGGENQPITAEQIHQILGTDTIDQVAAKFGMTPDALKEKLGEFLPDAVDKMTPKATEAAA